MQIHGAFHHFHSNKHHHHKDYQAEYIKVVIYSIQYLQESEQIMKTCIQIIDYRVEWIRKYEPLKHYHFPSQKQKDHRVCQYSIIRVDFQVSSHLHLY